MVYRLKFPNLQNLIFKKIARTHTIFIKVCYNYNDNKEQAMVLRNFLYLNEQILDGYLSAIEGYTPTKVTQTTKATNTKKSGISASVKVASGEVGKQEVNETETHMEIEISPASKVQKLIDYLSEESEIPFYEYMDESSWRSLYRDSVVEFMGNVRFAKIKEFAKAVSEIERLVNVLQEFSDKPLINLKTQKELDGIKTLNHLQKGNEIPCVLSFGELKEYKVVCYLNELFFKVDQDSFIGDVTILCKIQKKIDKGNSIQLTDIFKTFREMPLNREQRRSMPSKQQLVTPKEFSDIIRGPAFVVTPIAIYN